MSSKEHSDNEQPRKKKPYTSPVLESYGPITNFTTGGSRRRSEWKYMSGMSSSSSSGSSSGMMGGGGGGGSWTQSMSKRKNVVKS